MEKKQRVYSIKTKIIRGILTLFLVIVAALTVYPLVYIILGSFKENAELLRGGTNLFPQKFILDNYKEAWEKANFARYTFNSIVISVGVMCVTLFTTSMAGYVFARKNFWGKELLYSLFVAFMFVNVGSVTLRLIAAGTAQTTHIFLVRGFVNTVPRELDEAAKIDGCTFFQIYYMIILPLIKPILSTIALLSFRGGWNEYIMPLVFTMSNDKMRPLTVGVNMLKSSGDGTAAWNLMFAGATISIVPIIVIYIFSSKHFMSGMTSGAVKG